MTTCNHYIGVEKLKLDGLSNCFNTINENAERHTPFEAQAEVVPYKIIANLCGTVVPNSGHKCPFPTSLS